MRRLLLALGCAALLAPAAQATEIVPSEKRVIPYAADLPACGDPKVLAFISSRFSERESSFWGSGMTLLEYSHIKPLAWRPWGLDTIPRRYCYAKVLTSQGTYHRVDYSVREDLGFLGVGWGVEWCVLGLDRNLAYSPSCRMARP
jgi:opacity protein-like surface antigen